MENPEEAYALVTRHLSAVNIEDRASSDLAAQHMQFFSNSGNRNAVPWTGG